MGSKEKSWVFRVASAPKVGGGHIMRCLSIARELHQHRSVHFLLCEGGEYWIDFIESFGMTASIYRKNAEIKNKNILIDGYEFSDFEVQVWRDKCRCMVFIADECSTFLDFSDIVISFCKDTFQKKYKNQTILQGSEYALLAPEYKKNISNYRVKEVKNILITCGLIDSNNFINESLKSLSKINFNGSVKVAISSQAPHLKKLLNSINRYSFSVDIILDCNNLFKILMESDIIIGTGGVSLLERMALGIPSVTIVASENQKFQSEWGANIGATIVVNPIEDEFQHNLIDAIKLLLKSKNMREAMSKKGMRAIDGKGAYRVAKILSFAEC
jgi:UDP-2,4-diacetamido-2,4,6-trideoxy-beta-L-altropyranose hydrolase